MKQFFTWWNGATWNTRFYTWRKGEYVGSDQMGNRYYRAKSAMPNSIPERRWVMYAGYFRGLAGASRLASLNSSPGGYAAQGRRLHAARMGKAAP